MNITTDHPIAATRTASPWPQISLTVSPTTFAQAVIGSASLETNRVQVARIDEAATDADWQLIEAQDHPAGTDGRTAEMEKAAEIFAAAAGPLVLTVHQTEAIQLAAEICRSVVNSGKFPHDTTVQRAYVELVAALRLQAADALLAVTS